MSTKQSSRQGIPYLSALVVVTLLGAHQVARGTDDAGATPEVSTAALRDMLDSGQPLQLVNVLPKIVHDERHIPGSVNIPFGSLRTSPTMPADRDALLVFYCMGRLCLYSSRAATVAREMGYNNLRVYREGLLGWQREGLPTASTAHYPKVDVPTVSARELATRPEVFLVDIRPPAHFARGHAPGSANIDLEQLDERTDALPRDRLIALVDHKGKLTLTTGRFLASRGFNNVIRLDGGFNAWVKAGLPVERDPQAPTGESLPEG